ncbi:MAG: NADPH-dependent F420 reductase, partial [Dehalococcoidia bacterium]|nr:NADPH-dependent F420 reductase [Dehalococcoidia bacterium]
MIGFLGGTGPEGRGLGLRLALAGHDVMLGSREATRAQKAAERVSARAQGASIQAGRNEDVATRADVVFVTVPYEGQRPVLESLAEALSGKIVVTTVVPLGFDAGEVNFLPIEAGSAAMEAGGVLPKSRVVAAFQTISAHDLLNPEKRIDSDVVVCSDDEEAKATVSSLAQEIPGIRAVDGGGLRNAVFVE